MKEKITYVDMNLIDRPQVLARDTIDPEKVRELAESVREIGLQEPVILRSLNGRYEMVAGDRRYLAHKLIGAETIKAIVKILTDEDTFLIRATENMQRENLSPIEKARTYLMMKEKLGYTIEKISKRMGVRHDTVTKHLALLTLEEEFQKAIHIGKLGLGAAVNLSKIDDPDMRRYYLQAAVENGVTEEVARRWLEDYLQTKAAKFSQPGGGGGVPVGENAPLPVFFTCVGCRGPVPGNEVSYVGLCPECKSKLGRG